ncbi:MAG: class I SAM-dependent methyltransferase [Pseudomonadota bacterium]
MKADDFKAVPNQWGFFSAAPLPSAEELSEWYRKKYYQTADQRQTTYQSSYNEAELAHKRLMANQLLHAVELVSGAGGGRSFLDVGCGEGFALKAAHDRGWSVEGLDFNADPARHWNPEIGDRVVAGDAYALLDQVVASGRQVTACVLTNVLEHVLDPHHLLTTLRRVVEPGGVLAITVPNDFSALQKALVAEGCVEREYWFSPPSHLHYFDSASLPRFCAGMGFEVRDLYAGFPVEFFLLHPGSNYARRPDAGKDVHRARVTLDLMMADRGMDSFHALYRALAACDMGRLITVVLRNGEPG